MKREKADFYIKRYQLEHIVPLLLTVISVYFWFNYFEKTPVKFLGLIINILGLLVWWSAKITLAENWSAGYGKPQIKELVTKGIYSKIRHPLYWGVNLTLIGLSLLSINIWYILPSAIIVIYFFIRMRMETKFLTEKLGREYLDYKNNTWI